MKNIFKGKVGTAIIIMFTVVLAGVAIFTAIRLYQLRQQAVAPNVPSSMPRALTPPISNCSLTFTIEATPTGSPTATPTPTGSPTATPTGTATPTSTPVVTPNSCNGTCGSDSNCNSGLTCYNGSCRNASCSTDTDCVCSSTSTPASTSSATPASLPQSGTSWPTLMGAGLGILVILGSLLLVL